MQKFFRYPNFSESLKRCPGNFRHCETKNFRRKNVIPPPPPPFPPSLIQTFSIPEFFWDIEGMPTKLFGTVRPKIFDEKTWYPPFHPQNFLKPKIFSKTVGFPYESFRPLWDMKNLTGNRDMPPLIQKFFSRPEKIRKTEGFLYKRFCSGPVRPKNLGKQWCLPPPMHENSR